MDSEISNSNKPCSLPSELDTQRYGILFKLKIIYKFSVTATLLICVCTLFYSGLHLVIGYFSYAHMVMHQICGITLFAAVILHVIINRKKFIKLLSEFIDVVTRRAQPSFCNMDRLIASMQDYTIAQIAAKLNLDANELFLTLKNSGVRLDNASQTMREISLINHEKIFHAIVVIIESKFR